MLLRFASRYLHVEGLIRNSEIPAPDIIAVKQENINHADMNVSNLRSACDAFSYPKGYSTVCSVGLYMY
jgi:hypothetical protein